MSLDFPGGVSVYRALAPAYPFTIGAKLKHRATGVTDNIGGAGATGFANRAYMRVNSDETAGAVSQGNVATSGNPNSTSTLAGDGSTWQSVVVVFNSATDRRIYVDGADKQTNTTNVGSVVLNRMAWGSYYYNGAWSSAYIDALMCELVVWSVALSDAEVAAFDADGAMADDVNSNVLSWLRGFESGNLDDEVDAVTWSTNGGTPAYDADHAPGYSAGTTVTPGVASLVLTRYAPPVNQTINVPTAALALTPNAPGLSETINIPAAAVALTTYAPGATIGTVASVPAASLVLNPYIPPLTESVGIPVSSLVVTPYTPGFIDTVVIPTSSLSISALAAAITVTTNTTVNPGVAAYELTAYAPEVLDILRPNVQLSVTVKGRGTQALTVDSAP